MAKFNEERVDLTKFEEADLMRVGMTLQSLLAEEEFKKLKEDWETNGGYNTVPWWKFALDNVNVSYK